MYPTLTTSILSPKAWVQFYRGLGHARIRLYLGVLNVLQQRGRSRPRRPREHLEEHLARTLVVAGSYQPFSKWNMAGRGGEGIAPAPRGSSHLAKLTLANIYCMQCTCRAIPGIGQQSRRPIGEPATASKSPEMERKSDTTIVPSLEQEEMISAVKCSATKTR